MLDIYHLLERSSSGGSCGVGVGDGSDGVGVVTSLPDIKHPGLSVRLSDPCSQKFPTAAVDREGVWLGPEYNKQNINIISKENNLSRFA